MRKHNLQRALFILSLGLSVPLISGVAAPGRHAPNYVAGTLCYFVLLFTGNWAACRLVLRPLRRNARIDRQPFSRLFILCAVSALITLLVVGAGSAAWLTLHHHENWRQALYMGLMISAGAAVGFTLLFESVYLNEERMQEQARSRRLHRKYRRAELDVLKFQLEPHFMANALNNLLFLIQEDPQKAQLFTRRLAQVDEYFLRNRGKNLVPLADELAFVQDYYYLLHIRHAGKLALEIDISDEVIRARRIVPCALQIPLENAIKHNVLSSDRPLVVRISLEGDTLLVTNRLQPKPFLLSTTHIGLHNLSERYRLACRKAIDVYRTPEQFVVRLPLVA